MGEGAMRGEAGVELGDVRAPGSVSRPEAARGSAVEVTIAPPLTDCWRTSSSDLACDEQSRVIRSSRKGKHEKPRTADALRRFQQYPSPIAMSFQAGKRARRKVNLQTLENVGLFDNT